MVTRVEQSNIEPLLTAQQISECVQKMGAQISQEFLSTDGKDGSGLKVIGILKGASLFCSDLIRTLEVPLEIDFIRLSSYHGGTESSGQVTVVGEDQLDLDGQHVLIVEDIVDSGHTFAFLKEYLNGRGAKSVRMASLLTKPSRRVVDVEIDYVGFEIEDHFVIGYGLDYQERYRELPYIGILKQ